MQCHHNKAMNSRYRMKSGFKLFLNLLFAGSALSAGNVLAQQAVLIHSHNDYRQQVPFYQAYAQHAYSIEIDLFADAQSGLLKVAHDPEEVATAPSFNDAYLQPVLSLYEQHGGRPWKESADRLQFLIDLKTPFEPTLSWLVTLLNQYPHLFDPAHNPHCIQIAITGNIPDKSLWKNYPSYILFDADPEVNYTSAELSRVALMSASFRKYSRWNGKGGILPAEKENINTLIGKAHAAGKPFRFWGCPDGVTAWNTFSKLGVDIINTDKIEKCTDFFRHFHSKQFTLAQHDSVVDQAAATVKVDILDRATRGFTGFEKQKQELNARIPVYTPSFRNDGTEKPVKNIILMIGDGMGLSQINAAQIINRKLSFLQLVHIGLQQTHAKDEFTTDSAGAGSSLATGTSCSNRHISMSESGEAYPSLTERLAGKGYACGVVTSGNLADATPAAFYGHATERDDTDKITTYLLQDHLSLLAGSGKEVLTQRKDGRNLWKELGAHCDLISRIDSIASAKQPRVVCVDERLGDAATADNISLLANTTSESLQKLSSFSDKGIFLMVEGAKIDYAGHANSLPAAILETLSFDLAVSEALRFADANGETLVIVTGDHETGGLVLLDGDNAAGSVVALHTTNDHTPVMLPVFAYGPGAQKFSGVYPNTRFFHKILSLIP